MLSKMIKNNGFPLTIYELLNNSCVTSNSDYGHEVIGFHQNPAADKLHSKPIRFFLELVKLHHFVA
jgi:hypothetical protein